MSYAGSMHSFYIDYHDVDDNDTTGTLVRFSDSPAQTQIFPPSVGDIVIADDPDVDWPRWARVIQREDDWVGLKLLEPLSRWTIEHDVR